MGRAPPQQLRRLLRTAATITLSLLLLRLTEIDAAKVRVRVREGRSASAGNALFEHRNVHLRDTAGGSSQQQQLACGAGFRANALSTACPSVCGAGNFCAFYPPVSGSSGAHCTSRYGSTCYDGDSCTFECLTTWGSSSAWYITLFNDDLKFYELDALNSAFAIPSVLVNASVVTKLGEFKRPETLTKLTVAGNELATSLLLENAIGKDELLPRGEVVNFTFPNDFLRELKNVTYISIENIPFPSFADVDDLKFEQLETLYASNTMLKAIPIQVKNLPALKELDLGTNYIETIAKGALPTNLVTLGLGENMLREVPEDVKEMSKLTKLSLDLNPLREIPKGAIPISIKKLGLGTCSLKQIPEDIEKMSSLTDLDLSSNNFTLSTLDLSILPPSLKALSLDSLGLREIPKNLQRLSNLKEFSLTDNLLSEIDISRLPPQLKSLFIDACGLSKLPSRLGELTNLKIIDASRNRLTELQPGSLPASLESIYLVEAKLPTISAGVFPPSMSNILMVNTSLSELPPDFTKMTRLDSLTLDGNNLTKCALTDNLQTLSYITICRNALRNFSARVTAATFLALSENQLESLELSKTGNLQSLHLDHNKLTTIPPSIFNMTKLKVLALHSNPIKNYVPTVDEFAFLSKLNLLSMDAEQFFTACSTTEKKELHGYTVCPPGSSLGARTSSNGKGGSKTVSVVLNVLLVAVLVLVLVAAWHKRKLRHKKFQEMVAKEVAAFKSKESGIWEDDVLLKHRLDVASVKRLHLVAAGMYGEVWLATYNKRKVALKCLREKDATRELIGNFVEEIKLHSTLSHPKVVRFIGVVWTKESDIAVLTEFMASGDLRSYLDRTSKPTGAQRGWDAAAIRIALDVTEALVYLHSLEPKLIHRDLKSRNVLLDREMNAKLSDFGVSRFKLDDDVTMTANVGTVRWVAPEVLAGDRYDESADIFSLGVILSEIDTHALPYADARSDEGEVLSDSAIAHLVLSGSLSASFSTSCPDEIVSLASRCTSHDPKQRPTAVQVAFELRTLLLHAHSDSTLSLTSTERRDDNEADNNGDDNEAGNNGDDDDSDSAEEEGGVQSNTIVV